MDLNRTQLIGNVTRDPELRTTATGQNVTTFGVATNSQWTDAQGQKQTRAEFHNLVAWGKLAEICSQYLNKGKKVYVEGRLQTRDWDAQDGTKKRTTEIILENMIMLDRGGSAGPGGSSLPAEPTLEAIPSPGGPSHGSAAPDQSMMDKGMGDQEIRIEDIPF